MRRAVLDPGVLVSALISPTGAPARLIGKAHSGELELIVSPLLFQELEQVLARKKFRRYVSLDVVDDYLTLLRRIAITVRDPDDPPPLRSGDPDDDYLIALAHSHGAHLVSGDRHLLEIAGGAPIVAPADFLVD